MSKISYTENYMLSVKDCIRYYQKLLYDFLIPWSYSYEHRIIELYPNEIAIENYMMSIILKGLDK